MKKRVCLKAVSLVLAFVTLAFVFCGCKKDVEAYDESSDTAPSTLTVVSGGVTDYVILRSSAADPIERQGAMDIRKAFEEKLGVTIEIVDEGKYNGEKSICIGNVDKESVKELYDSLWYYDYVIAVKSEDILIGGGSSEKLSEAVDRFIEELLPDGITSLELDARLLIEERKTEKKVEVTLGENKLRDYALIVSDGVLEAISRDSTMLVDHCINNFGFGLKSLSHSSSETPLEIVIGRNTSRTESAELKAKLEACADNEGLIYFENGKIWLTGNTAAAIHEAIIVFIEEYLDPKSAQSGEIKLSAESKTSNGISDNTYRVMSFNLAFFGWESDDGSFVLLEPEERLDEVLHYIQEANPDILGIQEGIEFWYDSLCEALGDEYGSVGEMNTKSGQRLRNAIFYRKDKFELVETRTYWLSKTPEIMSRSSSATQYRILTYAVLRDKATGKTFVHANTHLGLTTSERSEQTEYLLGMLEDLDYPMIMTGDFNMSRLEGSCKKIQDAGYYDARTLLSEHSDTSVIDYVFVSGDGFHVTNLYSRNDPVNGINVSDHPAVIADVCLR